MRSRNEDPAIFDGGVLIRTASPTDYPGALDVLEEVAAERTMIGAEPPIDREGTRRSWLREFATGHSRLFVATADERIVGVAQMVGEDESRLGMYVRADVRGRRIGSSLLRDAIGWARDRGATRVVLEVWPHNTVAIHLYERFGFQPTGYLEKRYRRASGELWDSLEMTLALQGSDPTPARSR